MSFTEAIKTVLTLETFDSRVVAYTFLLVLIGSFFLWRLSRSNRKIVLLRCRSMGDKILLGFVGLIGVLCVVLALVARSRFGSLPLLPTLFMLLPWLGALGHFWKGTLTITKDGISYRSIFKEWEQIESYQWNGGISYTPWDGGRSYKLGLTLVQERRPYWIEGCIFPPDQKEAVDRVLAPHLPQAPQPASEYQLIKLTLWQNPVSSGSNPRR